MKAESCPEILTWPKLIASQDNGTTGGRWCAIGQEEEQYLGHLGHGHVHPQIEETATIVAWSNPKRV